MISDEMSRAEIGSPCWAIGLMTGTVLDGNIDIAALRTDGETVESFGPWQLARYPDAVQAMLPKALRWTRAGDLRGGGSRVDPGPGRRGRPLP